MKKIRIMAMLLITVLLATSLCACGKSQEGALTFKLINGGKEYEVVAVDVSLLESANVVIPSTHKGKPVTSIGERAFYNYDGIASVTVPEGVTSIGDEAFSQCRWLVTVRLPDSLESIGKYAFLRSHALSYITIPENVTEVGDGAFDETYLSLVINNSSVNLDDWFSYSVGIITPEYDIDPGIIETPEGVAMRKVETDVRIWGYIGEGSTVTLPSVPESTSYEIYHGAFSGRSDIESVIIPGDITAIGASAFCDCTGLTSITYDGTKAEWEALPKNTDWDENTGNYTVHCTDGDLSK